MTRHLKLVEKEPKEFVVICALTWKNGRKERVTKSEYTQEFFHGQLLS